MRLRFLLLLPLMLLPACERGTAPTLPVTQKTSAIRNAIAASRTQSYDMKVTSGREGEFEMTRMFRVTRVKTGAGWRTSIVIDPTAVSAGHPAVQNEIASIEIDERGNQIMTTNTGRRIPMKRGRASIAKDLRGMEMSESREGLSDVYDILPHIVFAKSEAAARIARVERAHLGQPVSRSGRLRYRQTTQRAIEAEYDNETGLSVRSTTKSNKGGSLTVDHSYKEAGSLIVLTSSRKILDGSAIPKVTTRTFSRITIDGKEIIP